MSSNLETFYNAPLSETDPALLESIDKEMGRQRSHIELIASENIVSRAVMEAQGSIMTNKYAEGYPGRRYYGGCEYVDIAESLAIERAKKLFSCAYANVQPHSGAQANGAVMLALIKPGDTILGMSLDAGGHLTHGAPPSQSGKWFNAIQYGVRRDNSLIDFEQIEALAKEHKPKMLIAGGSAYPREIDFKRMREIADSVGAYLLVDMAHISGLVAAGEHPSPIEHAHVVTTTTHKTLRGPRGGMILCNDPALGKKFNSAIFPGLQGGPLMHVIAAKAVAFGEALKPEFKSYTIQVKANDADNSLGRANITCNKNGVPFDPEKPMVTSGVRLGTPAGTSRGFGTDEFKQVGDFILEILDGLKKNKEDNSVVEASVRAKVVALCEKFPIY